MDKLTQAQRHESYKKTLADLLQCKANNELFFICPALRDAIEPNSKDAKGYEDFWSSLKACNDIADFLIKIGFNEFFKHRPPYADYAWFGGFDYEPRIKILEALITETAP